MTIPTLTGYGSTYANVGKTKIMVLNLPQTLSQFS